MAKRSRGAVMLAQVGDSQAEIAAKVKCKREEVSYFQTGSRNPGPMNRTRFKKHYGIPETAWDEEPERPKAAAPAAVDESIQGRVDRLQRTIDYFQEAALTDPQMTTRERLAVLGDAIAALRDLARLTGESQEISEAKLLKLPVLRKIVDDLVRALEPWPDAMRAAGEVLRVGVTE